MARVRQRRRSPPTGDPADQLRLLVEAQTDYAIFLLDPDGVVVSWNPGAHRIKGYEAEEIIGEHFSRFYTPEDIARNHPANELEIAAREGRYTEEGWRLRKDGSRFWAQIVITALRDSSGELTGFGKVTRDLTERKLAEEELAAAERMARAEANRMRRRAAALEEMERAIVASTQLDEIVQMATDAARDLTGAAFGAFFHTLHEERDESSARYTLSGGMRDAFEGFPLPHQNPLLATTVAGDGVVRSADIGHDPRLGPPDGELSVRSYLAVPVRTRQGEVAGGLFLGHPEAGVFGDEDEEAAVSIAASAAVALVNVALLREARRESRARQEALEERDRVARMLQQSLLPPSLPDIDGLELGCHYRAGTELVGGDFYDVFAVGEGEWGIVLGDVCGSGPPAAAETSLARHSVRTAAIFDADPARVLATLNGALQRADSGAFSSALFGRLRLPRAAGAAVTLALASAGHPPPIVCRADGSTEEVRAPGMLLGVTDDPPLQTVEVRLGPGDTIVLYTDGLIEARRAAELFGFERLHAAVAELREHPPTEIASGLAQRARAFSDADHADDIAVVVIRVPSGNA